MDLLGTRTRVRELSAQPRPSSADTVDMLASLDDMLRDHSPAQIAAVYANWLDTLRAQLVELGERLDDPRFIHLGARLGDAATAARKIR